MKIKSGRKWFDASWFRTLYFAVLVLLIPAVIIFNTGVVVREFTEAVTIELQRKALLSMNILNAAVDFDVSSAGEVQSLIEQIAASGEEFADISVFIPYDGDFMVLASLDDAQIGSVVNETRLAIAWQQNEAIAQQVEDANGSYWLVVRGLDDDAEKRIGLISITFSSDFIDSLIAKARLKSYVLLGLTVLLVTFILLAITRILNQQKRLQKRVGKLDEEKSRFVTAATHILRTPLNNTRWSLELLMNGDAGKLTQDQENIVRDVHRKNLVLIHAVQDMTVGINAAQQTLEVKPEKVQVKNILESALLEMRPDILAKQINIEKAVPQRVANIMADPALLQQALIKIIDNAIRYSDPGKTVRIQLRQTKAGVEISVTDQGIGIPNDEKDRVFDSFYRGRHAAKYHTDGSGLGLFIAKNIIDAHRGKIWFTSEEGKGTTFNVLLPRR